MRLHNLLKQYLLNNSDWFKREKIIFKNPSKIAFQKDSKINVLIFCNRLSYQFLHNYEHPFQFRKAKGAERFFMSENVIVQDQVLFIFQEIFVARQNVVLPSHLCVFSACPCLRSVCVHVHQAESNSKKIGNCKKNNLWRSQKCFQIIFGFLTTIKAGANSNFELWS